MAMIYNGKIITVKTDKIKFPDGHTSLYEFVLHKPAVAVVPVIDNNKILLIKQFRPVVNKKVWELPAGIIDKHETPVQAARRELEEETGLRPKKMKKIGMFYSSPGFTDEMTTLFIARDFIQTEQKFDRDENITMKNFTIKALLKMIKEYKFIDSKTVMGILWTASYLSEYSG